MSACYLDHDLLHLNAAALRRPAKHQDEPVVLRPAAAGDAAALARLTALDSAEGLHGDVLLAEVATHLAAALELETGRIVADPFLPTSALRTLLRTHARSLRRRPASRLPVRKVAFRPWPSG